MGFTVLNSLPVMPRWNDNG